ncbi:MAG: hypothetical protein JST68_21460 [Bacteroidetes bacterium]|nr:hypothetical protein [Bacteroidota bacterium]
MLQQGGFQLKPADYVRLLQIVEGNKEGDPLRLKYLLCPLVVTSEEEQKRFYEIFDSYIAELQAQEAEGKGRRGLPKRYRWLLFVLAPLMVAAGVWYFLWSPPPTPISFREDPQIRASVLAEGGVWSTTTSDSIQHIYAIPGDTILMEALNVDTPKEQIRWYFDNKPAGSDSIRQSMKEIGEHVAMLRVESGSKTYLDTAKVLICSTYLININQSMGITTAGQRVELAPIFRGDTSKSKGRKWEWRLNGKPLSNLGESFSYRLDTAGSYTFTYYYWPACGDSSWRQSQSVNYDVTAANQGSLGISVEQKGSPLTADPYRLAAWLWWLLLLVPALAFAYALIRDRRAQKKAVIRAEQALIDKADKPRARPDAGPHEVPMENHDVQLVARENEMGPLFRSMRTRVEDESMLLSIPRSIRKIIHSGGAPGLVFTSRMRQEEFLILIDATNVKSQQLQLFNYLARLLEDENIRITLFHYRTWDNFYNSDYPLGIPLVRLQELYRSSTLIIFGTASQLVHPSIPSVDSELTSFLKEWENMAILTPKPWPDWDWREKVLQENFILLPADIQGQLQLIKAIKERQQGQEGFLKKQGDWYEAGYYDFTDFDELKDYLGGDEDLLQWVCAVAIYPKIKWEMLVEVGRALLTGVGHPEKLNYTNLLRLVRIQWMQEGVWPEGIRLEMLKHLTVANELVARTTILEVLQYADLSYGEDHFFRSELEHQRMTNEFILFANGREEKYKDSYVLFKHRWENQKIFDGPLRRYLDKQKGDLYETPIQFNGENVSVGEYFGLADGAVKAQARKNRRLPYYRVSIVLAVSLVLGLFNKVVFDNKFGRSLHLVSRNDSTTRNIEFRLQISDTCRVDSAIREGNVKMEISAEDYASINRFENGKAILPYPLSLLSKTVHLRLNSDAKEGTLTADTLIQITNSLVSIQVRRNCPTGASVPPPIVNLCPLKSASLPPQLNEIWHGGTSNRLLTIDLRARLIYYSINNPRQYTTFRIESICGMGSNSFKVICRERDDTSKGHKPFFIKNVTDSAFDFSVCQDYYLNVADVRRMDTSYCDKFNRMTHYYRDSGLAIFLPGYLGARLDRSQKAKLLKYKADYPSSSYILHYTYNSFLYPLDRDLPQVSKKDLDEAQIEVASTVVAASINVGPFSRSNGYFEPRKEEPSTKKDPGATYRKFLTQVEVGIPYYNANMTQAIRFDSNRIVVQGNPVVSEIPIREDLTEEIIAFILYRNRSVKSSSAVDSLYVELDNGNGADVTIRDGPLAGAYNPILPVDDNKLRRINTISSDYGYWGFANRKEKVFIGRGFMKWIEETDNGYGRNYPDGSTPLTWVSFDSVRVYQNDGFGTIIITDGPRGKYGVCLKKEPSTLTDLRKYMRSTIPVFSRLTKMPSLLWIDDSVGGGPYGTKYNIAAEFSSRGVYVTTVSDYQDAASIMTTRKFDLIISNVAQSKDPNGGLEADKLATSAKTPLIFYTPQVARVKTTAEGRRAVLVTNDANELKQKVAEILKLPQAKSPQTQSKN